MNLSFITRALHKAGRALKNAGPEIAIIGGTVGLVTAGVFACKETPKALKVAEDHKEKIAIIEEASEKGAMANGEEYPIEQYKKDRVQIFTQDALAMAKVYAPAAILAIISITSILTGGKIFRGRLTTATTAYALLEQRFSNYRKGVVDKFGKDIDNELRLGLKNALVDEVKEDGTTEPKEIKTCKYDGYSDYARIFDETNPNWVKDGSRNLAFLEMQQQWATDKLKSDGVLFLNDVYRMLGMERSPEGQLVGWVYDPSDRNIDSHVDFGIQEILRDRERMTAMMHNQERSFVLDFNCDGRVLEKLRHYEKVPFYKI